MSDIHILEGRIKEKEGNVTSGSYTVAFHIPLKVPHQNFKSADSISIIPDISSDEVTALQAGTLLEIVESINYLSSFKDEYYMQRLKDRWVILNTEENEKYDFRVKYYCEKVLSGKK